MDQLRTLSQDVGELLESRNLRLACAESLTGGLLSSTIVHRSGASHYFLGSVVSYALSAKEQLLQVSAKTLSQFGAVSPEVACAMAEGARKAFGSDIALSVTGLAGPLADGSSAKVGEVYIGLSSLERTLSFSYLFSEKASRTEIRELAVEAALETLKNYLSEV